MAKSFKEIGKKAETLMEQGREADRKVQSFQASVATAHRQVAAAQIRLDAASETDENGNPKGDVEQARIQLNIAQNQLAASQRALNGAKSEVERVKREKNAHIQEIETHNRIERENIAKLEKLSSLSFAGDSASLTRGMVERFNQAEDTRVALLKSMGIEATADHIPIDGTLGSEGDWRVGRFGPLDLAGNEMSYQGGEGSYSAPGLLGDESITSSRRSPQTAITSSGENAQPTLSSDAQQMMGGNLSADAFRTAYLQGEMPIAQQIARLKGLREQALQAMSLMYAQAEAEGISEAFKVLKLSDQQRYEMGLRYIDNILEVYRDNLRARGVSDGEAMEAALAPIRAYILERLRKDIDEGTYEFELHEHPDFDKLAEEVRNLYSKYPPKFKINDYEREKIREGIRAGTITEKEIRTIGSHLRKHHAALVSERNAEWNRISEAQQKLMYASRNARTQEELEQIEIKRKLLMKQIDAYDQTYNSTSIMKAVLQSYRPLGPASDFHPQPYQNGSMVGSSKVIHALENVREAIPTDWVKRGNEKTICVKHVSRGYFNPGTNMDIIALSGNEQHMESVAFHEMGHRYEHLYPEILKLEKQFYERRTQGEQLTHLGPGYGPNEKSRFDHFINPYMGKDYGGAGYELLSMGMEAAYCETFNLSRDTEYQDLIFGILATV